VSVKCTGHVKWFAADVPHEQYLWVGLVVRVLLDYVTYGHDIFQVFVRDLSQPHALLGVAGDQVPVFRYRIAQRREVNMRHLLRGDAD
jgi:hypothetical protein